LAKTLSNFANNLADWHRDADALPYYERALKIREKKQKDHSDLAQVHNDYGIAYFHLGQYERAEKHYLSALKIWEKSGGPNLVGSAHFNLALIYSNRYDQVNKANEHFQNAYEKVSTAHMRAQVCRNFGNFIAGHRSDEEALPLLREARELARKAFGNESIRILDYNDALIPVLGRLGDDREATKLRRENRKIRAGADPGFEQ
jgi:tetratricopeptide (TPR) repeat protein